MHPWSAVTWAWHVLRGHSVTFAALFACGVLGVSVIAVFRQLLSKLGAPWYAWLLVPIIAVALLAKKEIEWMPELETRKKWARRLFFGSIAIAMTLALFGPGEKEQPKMPTASPIEVTPRYRR